MDVTGTIDTSDPHATSQEVRKIYESLFGGALFARVEEVLRNVASLFVGGYPLYQRSDTVYHDLEHTLQVYLAAARIFDGLVRSDTGSVSMNHVTLGLISALGHDTGFVKAVGDDYGHGGKYTLVHVERSKQFTTELMTNLRFDAADIVSTNNMISCTGIKVDMAAIPFTSASERMAGSVVGTADYLGQMSDPLYVKKLPFLFEEYSEGGVPGYASVDQLVRNTPSFYEHVVMDRLVNDFQSVYRFAATPADGTNAYLDGIRTNLAAISRDGDGKLGH